MRSRSSNAKRSSGSAGIVGSSSSPSSCVAMIYQKRTLSTVITGPVIHSISGVISILYLVKGHKVFKVYIDIIEEHVGQIWSMRTMQPQPRFHHHSPQQWPVWPALRPLWEPESPKVRAMELQKPRRAENNVNHNLKTHIWHIIHMMFLFFDL